MNTNNCLWCGKSLINKRNGQKLCSRKDSWCGSYYSRHKCSLIEWQKKKKKRLMKFNKKEYKKKYNPVDLGCKCKFCDNPATLFFQTIPYCRECWKNRFNTKTKEVAE